MVSLGVGLSIESCNNDMFKRTFGEGFTKMFFIWFIGFIVYISCSKYTSKTKTSFFFRHLSNTLVCIPQVQHRVGSCSPTGVRSSVKPVKRIFGEIFTLPQKFSAPCWVTISVWCRRKQKSRKCLWTLLSWRKCRLFQVYKGSNNTMWQVFNHAESKEFQRLHSPHLWCQKPPLVCSCTCKCCAEFCCGSRWNSWGNFF